MLFSSISFLYWFIPLTLLIYFIVPKKFRNFVLFVASFIFYFWGEPVYSLLIFFSAFVGWIHGLLLEKYRDTRAAKVFLVTGVSIPLALLLFFKYTNFFITNINSIFSSQIPLLKIVLPIGISFYTFQILSYVIDVYRKTADTQHNFIDFATYVMLFPQLIAGPIVRYIDVQNELKNRTITLEKFSSGIKKFCAGLAKKVLVANVLAELVVKYVQESPTVLAWWIYAFAVSMYIYFDFSGYSDMAIGLGRMLGFNFLENFNYPFISKSITEFWRRWHISLGSWFRDYVYIPMGGNRVPKIRWMFNILVVWFLTGFWHGAAWNYIIWGLFFAVILAAEKLFLLKYLNKTPRIVNSIYVVFLILISFVIFMSGKPDFLPGSPLPNALTVIGGMFGAGGIPLSSPETLYYLKSYAVMLCIGAVCSTPLPKLLVEKLRKKSWGNVIVTIAEPVVCCLVLILATSYLVGGSFSPFLYFEF